MACAALRHAYSYHRSTAMQEESVAPCKFWLQGRCNRSDACRFSHATANAPPPSRPRSPMSWRRPTASAQEAPPASEQQHLEEEEEAAPSMPILSENSAVVAPPEDTMTGKSTAASGGAPTGISVANRPTLVVMGEDGSFGVDDLQRLHAYITCVVDGPVQQLLHPGAAVYAAISPAGSHIRGRPVRLTHGKWQIARSGIRRNLS